MALQTYGKQMNQADAKYALKADDILTPEELAKRLKVGVGWVYAKSRRRGKFSGPPLPCLRMGRYLRFCWPDVVEWMRAERE
jgi:hypothetical protein